MAQQIDAKKMGEAFAQGRAFAKGLNHAKSSQLAEDAAKWITVHPGGKGPKSNGKGNKKGTPVLIDGETGKILGGMGGKFTGKKIGEVKKSFVGAPSPSKEQIEKANAEKAPSAKNKAKAKPKRKRLNYLTPWDYESEPIKDGYVKVYDKVRAERAKRSSHKGQLQPFDDSGIRVLRETDKAVQVNFTTDSYFDGNEESIDGYAWLPKSQIQVQNGAVIGMPQWLANKHQFGYKAAEPKVSASEAQSLKQKFAGATVKEGHSRLTTPRKIERETDRAVKTSDGEWLPKSQASVTDGYVVGVSSWIAKDRHMDVEKTPKQKKEAKAEKAASSGTKADASKTSIPYTVKDDNVTEERFHAMASKGKPVEVDGRKLLQIEPDDAYTATGRRDNDGNYLFKGISKRKPEEVESELALMKDDPLYLDPATGQFLEKNARKGTLRETTPTQHVDGMWGKARVKAENEAVEQAKKQREESAAKAKATESTLSNKQREALSEGKPYEDRVYFNGSALGVSFRSKDKVYFDKSTGRFESHTLKPKDLDEINSKWQELADK